MPESGVPKTHRTEPWALNPAGSRSVDEAIAIVRGHNVGIPEDVRILVADDHVPAGAHASYGSLGRRGEKDLIHWSDFYNRFGQIPVRIRIEVLASDEAIVAVLAHEVHEIESLRQLFAAAGGVMEAGRLYELISPEFPENLHSEAVDVGDKLVEKGEEPTMTVEKILSGYQTGTYSYLEAIFAIGRLVTPENVDSILGQLPPAFVDGLRRWAWETPLQGGVLIGSNVSEKEAQIVEQQLRVAIPALRARFGETFPADQPQPELKVR